MVLEESGITVLDNPEAFLEVDKSTVVFSRAPDVLVREIVSYISQPAVMIWDNSKEDWPIMVDGEPGSGVCAIKIPICVKCKCMRERLTEPRMDPFSLPLRGMLQDVYDELEFPDDEHFGNLSIYVRRVAT